MVALFSWFSTGGGSSGVSSSGGGDWGAFTPNVGGFDSGGGFGGFGGLSGPGSGNFGGGFTADIGGGGDFAPVNDGFTNSDPLGGTTTQSYGSITDMGTVTVTAPKRDYYMIGTLFNDATPYNPVDRPYDPSVPDLGVRVKAVLPDGHEEAVHQNRVDQALRNDQAWLFETFTGGIGAVISGVKAWINRDWLGLGFSLAGIGAGRLSRIDRVAFTAERKAFWKAEAANNPNNYSASDLALMNKGRPPIGTDGQPMELHHVDGTHDGGLEAMTRTDHRLGDNYRRNHPWVGEPQE